MKKVLLFSLAALSGVAAVAQVQTPFVQGRSLADIERVDMSGISVGIAQSPLSRMAKAPMATFDMIPEASDGTYYYGMSSDMRMYSASISTGSICAPSYLAGYVYTTYEGDIDLSWYYTNSEGARVDLPVNEQGLAELSVLGSINYPILVGQADDGTVLEVNRGAAPTLSTKGAAFATLMNHENSISMLDPAVVSQLYSGYSLSDGSNVQLGPNNKISELVQVFSTTTSPMVIYGGHVAAIGSYLDSNEQAFKNGSTVEVEIWTCSVDAQSYLQLNDKIGSTTIGRENILGTFEHNNITVGFEFQSLDEFGMPIQSPIVVPSHTSFAVVLKGIDNPDINMCFIFGSNTSANYNVPAGSYMKKTDSDQYTFPFAEDGATYAAMNYLFCLNADFPGVVWAFDQMEAPVDGGYLELQAETNTGEIETIQYNFFYSSVPMQSTETGLDNFTITMPEWVSLDQMTPIDGAQWSSTDPGYMVTFVAQPLPSGETGRSGYITISSPKTGQSWGIKVGQGEWDPDSMPSGVETAQAEATKAYVAGEELHLAYGEGFDRAYVYNVSGVRVASYSLPAGGQYVAPVSGLADGVYVVVLGGEKTETLKFVK